MENPNLKDFLRSFGLAETEIKIFTELSLFGTSRIGNLIKNTNLHRGTVYNTLQRLINKGLIYSNKKDNVNNYQINPNAFLSLIDEEKEELERKKEFIKKIRECLKISMALNNDEEPEVYCLSGEHAFKGFFLELLETNKKNDEKYLFLGNGGEMQDRLGAGYYQRSQKIKVLIGTKCKVILNIDKKEHSFSSVVKGQIKWLPKENDFSTVNTWIYNNKTVIVDWASKPLTTIVINNRNIAKNYETIWKSFWNKEAVKQVELYV